ncbi:MAG: hypothetical protein NTY77_01995 [Elusimicrobia bacterium]|nr:hypothetical protein [Elusimicrobiota bacterium]
MPTAWLLLLAWLPAAWPKGRAVVESPDGRTALEIDAEAYSRRAKACRADLKDFQTRPTAALVDSLAVCMEHPDAKLRAQVLDLLQDQRLWDLPDYESRVRPVLEAVWQRHHNDPDEKVQMHARQMEGWPGNAQEWKREYSPEGQERKRREKEESDRREAELDRRFRFDCVVIGLALAVLLAVGIRNKLLRRG